MSTDFTGVKSSAELSFAVAVEASQALDESLSVLVSGVGMRSGDDTSSAAHTAPAPRRHPVSDVLAIVPAKFVWYL
jgi:hypothetical protein